jgi:predicted kinase
VGLWIDAPADVMARRIATRAPDASDATGEVLEHQLRSGVSALDWHRLDGAMDANAVLRSARSIAS